LLLQDVPVLATGTRVGPVPGIAREAGPRVMGYGTFTVLATVDDAARIILAQQSGALFMALRGRGDGEPVLLGVHDSRELLRGIGPSLRTARRGSAVEVLVGGNGEPAPRRLWLQTGGRS
jgi:Flp pilus assembly protein CpaB